ncbi:hypothetical protein PRIPAC_71709, partial [Pristionchus pacificus]
SVMVFARVSTSPRDAFRLSTTTGPQHAARLSTSPREGFRRVERGRSITRFSIRNNVYGGRHQTAKDRARSQLKNKQAADVEKAWRVKIPSGQKYGAPFILSTLSAHVENLKPIMPKMFSTEFVFFVRDDDAAHAIRSVHRRIKHAETGDRLNIITNLVNAPWMKLKKEEKEAIEEVVNRRADQRSRALELNLFANDEAFTKRDLMMNLTKNNVFLAVVELIETDYSNLTALSLKDNRLKHLEVAAMLPYFAKNLKVLDLSNNHIDSLEELEKLKGLHLTTLFLENNPVCEKYTKASDYLRAVQDIFPRISMLDGNACSPRPDAFDEDKKAVEPQTKPGFYSDISIQPLIDNFIIEYFKTYDGVDGRSRKDLINAYDDENSKFTLCLESLYEDGAAKTRWANDANYTFLIRLSHNVKQEDKWKRNRDARIFRGAMDVTAQVCKMPGTRHLQETFLVDVVLTTPSLLIFSVQGLFEETPFAVSPSTPTLNFFSRTFAVTPKPNGAVAVISDELYLSALTAARVDRYRKQLARLNATIAPVAGPAAASAAVNDVADALSQLGKENATDVQVTTSADQQAAMVAAFSAESGMLPEWSARCLQDSAWNYQLAGQNFLASKDRIPKEAFPAQ